MGVVQLQWVFSDIVALVKDALEINDYSGIIRQQRHGKVGKSLLKWNGVHEEVARSIETMDANVVVKGAGLGHGEVTRDGSRVYIDNAGYFGKLNDWRTTIGARYRGAS